MVDLFTILVVAILRSSSPEAPLNLSEDDFRLPLSVQENPKSEGVEIDIGLSGIYLDGRRTGSTVYWEKQKEPLIEDLNDALQLIREDNAQIRAHAEAPWSVVGKVMFTLRHAGYSEIELIALNSSSL